MRPLHSATVVLVGAAAAFAAWASTVPYTLPPAPATNYLVQMGAANPTIVNDLTMAAGDVVDFQGIGLGALAGGKGEFVLFDGSGWLTDSDGRVSALKSTTNLGYFGIMSHYTPTGQIALTKEIGCLSDLNDVLNDLLGADNKGRMAIFKIDGLFDTVKFVYDDPFHSDPINLTNVRGTVLGTKSGAYVAGDSMTVGGIDFGLSEHPFHAHFVSDDRSTVGHVMDCAISKGTVTWALADTYDVRLPFSGEAVAKPSSAP